MVNVVQTQTNVSCAGNWWDVPRPYSACQICCVLAVFCVVLLCDVIIPLRHNDPYSGHTAPLTSKHCVLYIYSSNIGTEYFKCGIYSPFFFSSKCSLFQHIILAPKGHKDVTPM